MLKGRQGCGSERALMVQGGRYDVGGYVQKSKLYPSLDKSYWRCSIDGRESTGRGRIVTRMVVRSARVRYSNNSHGVNLSSQAARMSDVFFFRERVAVGDRGYYVTRPVGGDDRWECIGQAGIEWRQL